MATAVSKLTSAGDHFITSEYDEWSVQNVERFALNQYSVATSGGILRYPNSTNFTFSGNFTIEAYLYMITNNGTEADVAGAWNTTGGARSWIFCDINPGNAGGTVTFFSISLDGSNANSQGIGNVSYTFPTGQWVHVAVCRVGTTVTAYVNGSVIKTGTVTGTNLTASGQIGIGAYSLGGGQGPVFPGYISNFHVVNGTALYTSAFSATTPFIRPIQPVANTVLLTCQSSFLDKGPLNLSYTSVAASLNTNVPTFTYTGLGIKRECSNGSFQASSSIDEYTLPYNSYATTFNGSTQYLTATNSQTPGLTSENFTIECWFNLSGLTFAYPGGSYGATILNAANLAVNGGVWVYIAGSLNTPTSIALTSSGSTVGPQAVASGLSIALNVWHHLAISRSGSNLAIWLDGTKLTLSLNNIATSSYVALPFSIGRCTHSTAYAMYTNGSISNLRLVKGTPVYDPTGGNITVPRSPLTAVSGTYLLTCQNQTIVDNSTNAFPITNPASATTSLPSSNWVTTKSKQFSNGSYQVYGKFDEYTLLNGVYASKFNGSSQYLTTPTNTALTFGTGNFTIEFWIYATAAPVSSALIYDNRPASTQGVYTLLYLNSDRTMRFWVSSADRITSTALTLNTWYHIALVKNSNVTTMYLNGTATGLTYSDTNNYLASATNIAAGYAAGASITNFFTGYLSNLRVVKGTAVYTSNFTPVREPSLPTPNTSLLTCQLPTIEDNSTNVLPVTNNGATNYYFLTKFYSGIFNSNRYLSVAAGAGLNFSTSNFTMEFMAMRTSASTQNMIATNRSLASTTFSGSWWIDNSINNQIRVTFFTGGTYSISNSNALDWPAVGTWFHFAVVRNGTTLTGYLNGTTVGSVTVGAVALGTGADNIRIGGGFTDTAAWYWPGYISNFRIVKGIALYTADFTPSVLQLPTSNLTAISGSGYSTSLLTLNSATIVDNSGNGIGISNVGGSPVSAPIFI